MNHIAIMNPARGMIPKLLKGEKTIESRWSFSRRLPWNAVHSGDTLFFKQSGGLVVARAAVSKVIQYEDLTPGEVSRILERYGKRIGISKKEIPAYKKLLRTKRYCVLIFLQNVSCIKPFRIDKKGWSPMSSWLILNK